MSIHGGIISRFGDEDGKSSVSDVNNGQCVFVETEADFFALRRCIMTVLSHVKAPITVNTTVTALYHLYYYINYIKLNYDIIYIVINSIKHNYDSLISYILLLTLLNIIMTALLYHKLKL